MSWLFGKKPAPPSPSSADIAVARATTAEMGAKGVQSGVAVATAVGVSAAVASGPLLPVVAGVGILAAAALKMYFLNKKLTELFKRAEKITRGMLSVLKTIEDRKMNIDTGGVREAAEQIQKTIGELIGPQALKEIQEKQSEAVKSQTTKTRYELMGRLNRYGRMLAPASTITLFNERLLYLTSEFSMVLGHFAVQLDKLPPAEAVAAAEQAEKKEDPSNQPVNIAAAQIGATTNQDHTNEPSGGTRRRRRYRKTRKINIR